MDLELWELKRMTSEDDGTEFFTIFSEIVSFC